MRSQGGNHCVWCSCEVGADLVKPPAQAHERWLIGPRGAAGVERVVLAHSHESGAGAALHPEAVDKAARAARRGFEGVIPPALSDERPTGGAAGLIRPAARALDPALRVTPPDRSASPCQARPIGLRARQKAAGGHPGAPEGVSEEARPSRKAYDSRCQRLAAGLPATAGQVLWQCPPAPSAGWCSATRVDRRRGARNRVSTPAPGRHLSRARAASKECP